LGDGGGKELYGRIGRMKRELEMAQGQRDEMERECVKLVGGSKGVADIGPLQEQLKEARSELAMAKHVANCQRVQLQEENQKLRLQLQELKAGTGTSSKDTTEEQQGKKELATSLEEPIVPLQEAEQQAQIEVQALKEQLQQKEAQLACMASWAMEAI